MNKEVRSFAIETRDSQNSEMICEGYAAVTDQSTVLYEIDGVQYNEVMVRGCFDGADLTDVPFKYNHSDSVMIMARTRNKTLDLAVDDKGLKINARLADTTAGNDLYKLLKRGDIDKMSFAFTVKEDSYDRDTRTRKILKVAKIWDVAAVDTPAYDTTSINARSYFELEREKEQKELDNSELRKRLIISTLY